MPHARPIRHACGMALFVLLLLSPCFSKAAPATLEQTETVTLTMAADASAADIEAAAIQKAALPQEHEEGGISYRLEVVTVGVTNRQPVTRE